MSGQSSYRDRIYMIKDIILMLVQYGELNQTALVSFCGLNLKKHKPILHELESHNLIKSEEKPFGKRTVTIYKPTPRGMEFCKTILDPYETLFPRKKNMPERKDSL
jgi:predicted transcriptional regulator